MQQQLSLLARPLQHQLEGRGVAQSSSVTVNRLRKLFSPPGPPAHKLPWAASIAVKMRQEASD